VVFDALNVLVLMKICHVIETSQKLSNALWVQLTGLLYFQSDTALGLGNLQHTCHRVSREDILNRTPIKAVEWQEYELQSISNKFDT
jgi:hypothetical protein